MYSRKYGRLQKTNSLKLFKYVFGFSSEADAEVVVSLNCGLHTQGIVLFTFVYKVSSLVKLSCSSDIHRWDTSWQSCWRALKDPGWRACGRRHEQTGLRSHQRTSALRWACTEGWSDYENAACLLRLLSWYTAEREDGWKIKTKFGVRFVGLNNYITLGVGEKIDTV